MHLRIGNYLLLASLMSDGARKGTDDGNPCSWHIGRARVATSCLRAILGDSLVAQPADTQGGGTSPAS